MNLMVEWVRLGNPQECNGSPARQSMSSMDLALGEVVCLERVQKQVGGHFRSHCRPSHLSVHLGVEFEDVVSQDCVQEGFNERAVLSFGVFYEELVDGVFYAFVMGDVEVK